MTQVILPFNIQNGDNEDADAVMANYTAIVTPVNGSLQAGVNVAVGTPGPVSSGSAAGSSLSLVRADHTHSVQGVERLTADPASGNFVGREYFNTATLQKRTCTALPATWTTGTLSAGDLPNHAIRHAFGGGDDLPSGSIIESMMRAHTLFSGVPSADVVLSAATWTDVVTGVTVTITGTSQTAVCYLNAGVVNNSGSNSPTVAMRVLDGASTVLFQTSTLQMGAAAGSSDAKTLNAVYPLNFTASPTLKLQVAASTSGITVRKSQTFVGSAFGVTSLNVVVG